MSEVWQIALATLTLTAFLSLCTLFWKAFGKIYEALNNINNTLKTIITRPECEEYMGEHCEQIAECNKKIQNISEDFAKLKGKIEIWHDK